MNAPAKETLSQAASIPEIESGNLSAPRVQQHSNSKWWMLLPLGGLCCILIAWPTFSKIGANADKDVSHKVGFISGAAMQRKHEQEAPFDIHTPMSPPAGSKIRDVTVAASSVDDGPASGGDMRLDRRAAIFGGLSLAVSAGASAEKKPYDYGLWGVLPVGPYKAKKSGPLETLVPGQVWTIDQKFGILNVQVPVRMTIIKLKGGGLWILNPIAATRELLGMVRELEKEHGPVKHVVLGTLAIEHKTYAGVFAQKFPQATVWLQPGQYDFPVNLPPEWTGFPLGRTKYLPSTSAETPWSDDFDQATLGPFISRDGAYGETAFFHKPTKTLLVTDAVQQVSTEVPKIFLVDEASKKPLLYHSRDGILDKIDPNDMSQLERGWRRIQLFGLYFMPAALDIHSVPQSFKERRPDVNPDFGGIYPWDWVGDDKAAFKALRGDGKDALLVAPILQTLILNRNPVETLDWVDRVCQWNFARVVPAHLQNNIPAGPKAFRRAFTFLEEKGEPAGQPKPRLDDLKTLLDAEVSLTEMGAIAPNPGKVTKTNREAVLAKTTYRCRGGFCSQRSQARQSLRA